MKYKFRNFCIADIKVFADMLGAKWDLGKSTTNAGKLCDWIYAFEILRTVSEMVVLTDDNNHPIGFSGYNQNNNKRRWFWHAIYTAAFHTSFLFVNNKKILENYYNTYSCVPSYIRNQFDAELTILIIDEKFRGHGLGNILFNEVLRRTEKSGVKNLQIDTDDSCSVGFYIKSGCKEVYRSKVGKNGEPNSENVYVFSKKLK